MAVEFYITNYDKIFSESKIEPFVINDHDGSNKEVKARIDDILFKNQTGDSLSLVPSCNCGELKGAYYIGTRCGNPTCNSVVVSPVDEELNYLAWFRRPKGVAKLITPFALALLLKRYKKSNLVQYIMQSNYKPKLRTYSKDPRLVKLDLILETNKIKRGYNSFVTNFEKIVELLEYNFGKGNKKSKHEFVEWIKLEKNNIFSSVVPLPNRGLFILDNNEGIINIDRDIILMLDAARRMTGIDLYDLTLYAKENKTAASLIDMANFYESYIKDVFFKKLGLIRKHISRTRSHFTARSVVITNYGPHVFNELYLPWSSAVTLFTPQIFAGMLEEGYSFREIERHIMEHIDYHSPIIRKIFDRLLSNGPIHCLLNRNPTLHRGSFAEVMIPIIKDNPNDKTFTVSPLLCPGFNMDFDGDALNLTPLFTKEAIEGAKNYEPYLNVLGLTGPNEFSNAITFPKTVIETMAKWYEYDHSDEVKGPPISEKELRSILNLAA